MISLESLHKKQLASAMTPRDWALLAFLSETRTQFYTRLPHTSWMTGFGDGIDLSYRSALRFEDTSFNYPFQEFGRILRPRSLTSTVTDWDETVAKVRRTQRGLYDNCMFCNLPELATDDFKKNPFKFPEGATLRILNKNPLKFWIKDDPKLPARGAFMRNTLADFDDELHSLGFKARRMKASHAVEIKWVHVPARVHNKSKGGAAYHARVQKKWLYRFGTIEKKTHGDTIMLMYSQMLENLVMKKLIGRHDV